VGYQFIGLFILVSQIRTYVLAAAAADTRRRHSRSRRYTPPQVHVRVTPVPWRST
jgi:hypothetical protein